MIFHDANFIDEAFAQVPAKAGGVGFWQTHVLVEVKHFDAAPIDAGRSGQYLQELELRCPGSRDDARPPTLSDGFANDLCRTPGSRNSERYFVGQLSKQHATAFSASIELDGIQRTACCDSQLSRIARQSPNILMRPVNTRGVPCSWRNANDGKIAAATEIYDRRWRPLR